MSYNTKNYEKQGGDEWVVGGTLTVTADGKLVMRDKLNGKDYEITLENGVVVPVEV